MKGIGLVAVAAAGLVLAALVVSPARAGGRDGARLCDVAVVEIIKSFAAVPTGG